MAIKRLVVPSELSSARAQTQMSAPGPTIAVYAPKRKLTPEQEAICASKADVIKVSAFAGTGKSTALCAFSEAYPAARVLNLAFNKSTRLEAEGKFPRHVTSKTAHAIGWDDCGRDYSHKMAADIRPFHIQRHLNSSLRSIPVSAHNLYGARVIETIKSYLVSADAELGLAHVSVGQSPAELKFFDGSLILRDAKRVWHEMQNIGSDIPMLHDGYLKLYQVKGRVLPYDIILFDEAQDTNPVIQAIVEAQPSRKVYVGDRHQAIYGFRGATNAMELIRADEHHYLTGSFRFGAEIAEVANKILLVKNEDVQLHGRGARSRIGFVSSADGYAYIARGNSAIFNRAVQCVANNEPFSFVGDIKGYRFDQIRDVYNLVVGDKVKDAFVASFSSTEALSEYADATNDREILSRCKLVAKYGNDIPKLIERIERSALPSIVAGASPEKTGKRIVLTTAHKSKGLEFDNVKLAGDFMSLLDDEGRVFNVAKASPSDIEDVNIQYVAVTRAIKALSLSESLEEYLDYASTNADQAACCP